MTKSSSKQTIEDSIQVALDAADTATNVVEQFNKVNQEFEVVNIHAKRIYQSVSIIFVSAISAAVISTLIGFVMYYKNLSTLKESAEMNVKAVALLAENITELRDGLGLLEENVNNQEGILASMDQLQSAAAAATKNISNAETRYKSAIKQSVTETNDLLNSFVQKVSETIDLESKKINGEILTQLDVIKKSLTGDPIDEPGPSDSANRKISLELIYDRMDEIIFLQKDIAAKILEANRLANKPKASLTPKKLSVQPKVQPNPLQLN